MRNFFKNYFRVFHELLRLEDNPLYNYLIDLLIGRIELIDILNPERHVRWQLSVMLILCMLGLLHVIFNDFQGLPVALMVILMPIPVFGGLFLSGLAAQADASRNYPSPLDDPHAIELLLESPLTEAEIVAATVGSVSRFPLLDITWSRKALKIIALWVINVAFFVLFTAGAALSGGYNSGPSLLTDIIFTAVCLYAPALAVFAFFPLLSALDILLVPVSWVKIERGHVSRPGMSSPVRSGRLPYIAAGISILSINAIVLSHGGFTASTTRWVLLRAVPVIISVTGIAVILLLMYAEKHLCKLRTHG